MKTQSPNHLHLFEGDLYDSRTQTIIRKRYAWSFRHMDNLQHVKATLRAGSVTSLGGYPLFLITSDCAALCFECARKEWRQIVWDFLNKASTGWRVTGCEVNHEDNTLYCDHCSNQIPSAYGED